MAFLMELKKESNHNYEDYQAYWSIENITFESRSSYDGEGNKTSKSIVNFALMAYPSRASKIRQGQPLVKQYAFGGCNNICVSSVLYEWKATFYTEDVFPDGIPVAESEQREVLYAFVKDYLQLENYLDVFEDGQNG